MIMMMIFLVSGIVTMHLAMVGVEKVMHSQVGWYE